MHIIKYCYFKEESRLRLVRETKEENKHVMIIV